MAGTLDDFEVVCNNSDRSFGPSIDPQCRGGFDFTLFFEQIFLSIVPSTLLLVLLPFRLVALRRAPRFVPRDRFCLVKLITIFTYSALQLACLVLWTSTSTFRTKASIPAVVLSLASAVALFPLSFFEHTRTIRPAPTLGIFFSFTTLFDVVIARTLWLAHRSTPLSAVFTTGIAIKGVLLVLEAQRKTPLAAANCALSKEAASGVYSRSFFWWLNPLFLKGRRKILVLSDLSPLQDDFSSECLGSQTLRAWEHVITLPHLAAIDYVADPSPDRDTNRGYGLIGATALTYLGIAISHGCYGHRIYSAVTKIRGCLVAVIYHKTLRITSGSTKASASLTLMSADVDRIALTVDKSYELVAGLVEVGITIYLLERQIGWACIAPLTIGLVSAAGNSTIAKLLPKRLKQWTQATQERVALTSTVFRNMRSIKMMGMSPDISNTIQGLRTHELKRSAHFRWFIAFMNLFGSLPKLLSAPFAFALFVFSPQFFSEGGLSAARAFTTLSLIELLTTPLGKVLQALPHLTAASGCMERIQDYLSLEEQFESRLLPSTSSSNYTQEQDLTLEKGGAITTMTDSRAPKATIKFASASFRYKPDSPVIIRNATFDIEEGSLVMVIGPVGSGKTTLLRGIVGQLAPFEGSLSLRHPEVGYCSQTPWLVNSTVRKNVVGQSQDDETWYRAVTAACALDHDIATFPDGDEQVIGSGGITLSGGQKHKLALARAVYARTRIVVLDDVMSALDARTEGAVFESLLANGGLLRKGDTTVILATNDLHQLPAADRIVALDVDGKMSIYESLGQMEKLNGTETIVKPNTSAVTGQRKTDEKTMTKSKPMPTTNVKGIATESEKETARRTGDLASYSTYGRSMGYWRAFVFLVIAMLFAFCSRFSHVWLGWFTDNAAIDRPLFLGVYVVFAVIAIALSLSYFWWMMIIIVPISGSNIHQQLLNAIFGAPLSLFTSVDAGVILNRFTQDMNYATSILPISTMNTVTAVIVCIAQFALIASGAGYLALSLPLLLITVFLIQKSYLATSRQLRLLDLEHKSPLYTVLTETIDGLSTIRAYGWSRSFEQEFLSRLDDSQRPVYMLYCIQRWLNLVLDLIVAALAVLLMTFATQLPGISSGPALGVAMVSVLGFGQSLSQFIVFYTELETSLGAIARIREYTTGLVSEDGERKKDGASPVLTDWPGKGEVCFENVCVAYGPEDDLVLKEISLTIPAGQVIGICGRTGSGKSSLTLALLRLLDLRSGAIFIDGIDVSTVPRQLLRSRISTIPQDPFFPPTHSLRRNLVSTANPTKHPDAHLLAVLHRVGLLSHAAAHLLPSKNDNNNNERATPVNTSSLTPSDIPTATATAILNAPMSALPLSAGQRQLFCLARALLQDDNRIVVLDEVTSAMDAETEGRVVQEVLREGLRGRTVIMIAHREAVREVCDVVVEVEGGRVKGVVGG